MDDRPAPTVTITDPRRPAPAADVLFRGDEKAPWRPKRWQYELLALLLALGLAVAVPQQVVSDRAADRRAALAAADAARVSVSLGVVNTGSPLQAVITNDGPDAVTVLSLRLEADGYRTLPVGATAKAIRSVPVLVPDTLTCTTSLVNGSSGGLATVRLRVAGRTVSRTVVVNDDLWQALTIAAQDRCGYLPGSRALVARLSTRPVAAGLEVSLALTNQGRLPLSVGNAFSGLPGLEVLAGAPSVVVPARGRAVTYRFRVRVSDCSQARPDGAPVQAQVQLDTQVMLSSGSSAGDSVALSDRLPALNEAIARLVDQRCGKR